MELEYIHDSKSWFYEFKSRQGYEGDYYMTVKMEITTVGDLIDFLKDLPRDTEIYVENYGKTGFQDGSLEIEKNIWDGFNPDVCINVRAESGYY